MDNIICGIYKITSPSKKVYIGQSVNIKKRLKAHSSCIKKETLLQRSINKYGYNNHKVEIIHICEKHELNNLEIYYIQLFNCFNSKFGMNLKGGGQNGGCNSEEVKAKLRKPKSAGAKEKYRLAALRRPPVSAETREKHRQDMLGNKNLAGSNHMIGFKHSEETRAIIKEKRKLQIMPTGFKRPWSEEQKRNKSIAMTGKNNPRYKHGRKCKKINNV